MSDNEKRYQSAKQRTRQKFVISIMDDISDETAIWCVMQVILQGKQSTSRGVEHYTGATLFKSGETVWCSLSNKDGSTMKFEVYK